MLVRKLLRPNIPLHCLFIRTVSRRHSSGVGLMSRTLLAWSLVGLITAAAGCKMCAHPYDYCGPVVGPCQSCNPIARAGSILSPPIDGASYEGQVEETEPTTTETPTLAPAPDPRMVPRPAKTHTSAKTPKPTKASAMAKAPRATYASASRTPKYGNRPTAKKTTTHRSSPTIAKAGVRTKPVPSQATNKAGSNFFPGIPPENILSITDRRIDEDPQQADEPAASQADQTQQAEQAPEQAEPRVVQAAPAATTKSPVKATGGWVAKGANVVRP